MNFELKIKPNTYTASTKDGLIDKMKAYGWSSGGGRTFSYSTYSASSIGRDSDKKITVFVFEKHRQKTKQVKTKDNKTKSTIVKKAHWIGYKYEIPFSLVEAFGLEVIQHSRNFTLRKFVRK